MYVIKVIYTPSIEFEWRPLLALQVKDNLEVMLLDIEHYKTRKKAIQVKASCGARLDPFVAVYHDGELVKAFYSETGDCTYNNVIDYINDIKNK